VTVNPVSYYNTSDSSTTSLTIESLYICQVEYICTVKALLSENEFGENSREIVFWTKPEGK